MGTGKSGRCLNTHGSARTVSDFALVHSIEGEFTQPMRRRDRLRLKSGGHGQKGMLLLDKYGIEYNIVRTYPNGVRVGIIRRHGKIATVFPVSVQPVKRRRKKK